MYMFLILVFFENVHRNDDFHHYQTEDYMYLKTSGYELRKTEHTTLVVYKETLTIS